MGIKVRPYSFAPVLPLLALLAPVSQAAAGAPGAFDVSGQEIWLDGCAIAAETGSSPIRADTGLPEPCEFALKGNGDLQIVEDGGRRIVLVVSSRKQESGDCDTRVRAVVLENEVLKISEDTQRIASCAVADFDEKMFLILGNRAHRVDR